MSDVTTGMGSDLADPPDIRPCGAVMATCQNEAGHPGAHWHPRVTDEPGVIPLRPEWYTASIGADARVIRIDGSSIDFGDAIYHPENAEEARAYAEALPSAPDHRLREAAQAVLDAVEPRPTGSPGMTLTPTVRYNAESIIALRAVLSEATPDPEWNAADHRADAKLVQAAMQKLAERRLPGRKLPFVPIEDASDLLMALHRDGIYRPEATPTSEPDLDVERLSASVIEALNAVDDEWTADELTDLIAAEYRRLSASQTPEPDIQ